jgi:hypothetical protein
MGFLDGLRKALGSSGTSGGDVHWIYARCNRCGEPLLGRVDLRYEPSRADDGETWIVRKGLVGSGQPRAGSESMLRAETASVLRCYQVVEVTLTFDAAKREVLAGEAVGGELIDEEAYEKLKGEWSTHA